MTKKDYIIIADALIESYKLHENNDEFFSHKAFMLFTVKTMALALQRTNTKFNNTIFISYIEERI